MTLREYAGEKRQKFHNWLGSKGEVGKVLASPIEKEYFDRAFNDSTELKVSAGAAWLYNSIFLPVYLMRFTDGQASYEHTTAVVGYGLALLSLHTLTHGLVSASDKRSDEIRSEKRARDLEIEWAQKNPHA